ncbi:MAG: branched-chain amino acid ABC transporter permease, partial [Alphaproteobacteria bacterium]
MNLPHWRIAVWLLGALVLPLILPSDYDRGLLALAAIYALLGLSMNLTFGYLGYISFGHAAFFGLGAYFAALLNMKIGVDFWLAAALAMVPTAALGALIGFASIRIGGVYFAITTLTVAEIFRLLAANWIELTRGPMGIVVPRPTIGILDATGLGFRAYFLMLVILVLGAVVWMISRMLAGAYGRAWLAIRESRDLAEAVGISTLRSRVENIALSGALAGLAGALLVPHVAIVSPDLFSPSNSAMALLIVVLGGVGTLAGPIVGGVLFAWLPEVFRDIGDLRFVAFALLLLIVIRVQPDGIVALFKRIRRALIRQDHVVREAKSAPAAGIATETPAAASAPPSAVTIADSRSVVENADVLLTVERLTKQFRGVE